MKIELSDTELNFVTAGTLRIGDSNGGAITISQAINVANNLPEIPTLHLTSGNDAAKSRNDAARTRNGLPQSRFGSN